MMKLFFKINGQFRKYTTKKYEIKDGFYYFIDEIDNLPRKLSKEFYKGEEGVKE